MSDYESIPQDQFDDAINTLLDPDSTEAEVQAALDALQGDNTQNETNPKDSQ